MSCNDYDFEILNGETSIRVRNKNSEITSLYACVTCPMLKRGGEPPLFYIMFTPDRIVKEYSLIYYRADGMLEQHIQYFNKSSWVEENRDIQIERWRAHWAPHLIDDGEMKVLADMLEQGIKAVEQADINAHL